MWLLYKRMFILNYKLFRYKQSLEAKRMKIEEILSNKSQFQVTLQVSM